MFLVYFYVSAVLNDRDQFRLVIESDSNYRPSLRFKIGDDLYESPSAWLSTYLSYIAIGGVEYCDPPIGAKIRDFPGDGLWRAEVVQPSALVFDRFGNYYVRLSDGTFGAFDRDVNAIMIAVHDATEGLMLKDRETLKLSAVLSTTDVTLGQLEPDLEEIFGQIAGVSPMDLASEPDGEVFINDDGTVTIIEDEATLAARAAEQAELDEELKELDGDNQGEDELNPQTPIARDAADAASA